MGHRSTDGGAKVDYGSLQKEIENQLRIAKLQARCPGCPRGVVKRWHGKGYGLGIDPPI